VIVLLAAKAGLRASEIANLTWDMVLGPTADIGLVIELRDIAAKNGSGRLIPAHPDLRHDLAAYRGLSTSSGPVIRAMTMILLMKFINTLARPYPCP
jgi:integrase/recombinase XerD